jgi:hypothetical protein
LIGYNGDEPRQLRSEGFHLAPVQQLDEHDCSSDNMPISLHHEEDMMPTLMKYIPDSHPL